MPSARATSTRSLSLRMTDDDFAPIAARADRLGISASEAMRQLVQLGSLLERGEQNGVAVSNGVAGIISRREPLICSFATDPDDAEGGPMWLALPEEVEAEIARQQGDES